MGATAEFNQRRFRFRNDNGSESAATWIADENIDVNFEVENTFRIRFTIEETTGSKSWTDLGWGLYFSLNSGAYTYVVNEGTGAAVEVVDSTYLTSGDDTTRQLTDEGGGFVTDNDGVRDTATMYTNSGSGGNFFEIELCIKIDTAYVNTGDTIDLRIQQLGNVLDGYDYTPHIIVIGTHHAAMALSGQSALTVDAFTDHHAKLSLDGESALTCTAFVSGAPTTYYVDATGGDDENGGESELDAWQTIGKVNSETFVPGDTIKFKRGETWSGTTLVPPDSGTSGNPITFEDYGSGALPVISGNDTVNRALSIDNDSEHYLEFNNIHFTAAINQAAYVMSSYIDFNGCLFTYSGGGLVLYGNNDGGLAVHHINVINCQFYENDGQGTLCDASPDGEYGPHDILYQYCTAYNNGTIDYSDHGFYVCFGVVVDSCISYNNHYAGFKVNCESYYSSPYSPVIKNCISYGNECGIYVGAIDALIYNNLVYSSTSNNVVCDSDADNCEFYFNTFVNSLGSSTPVISMSAYNSAVDTIWKNNLFIQDSSVNSQVIFNPAESLANFVANITLDYNVYYRAGTGGTEIILYSNVDGSKSFNDLVTAGEEANGAILTSLPDFVTRYTDFRPLAGGNIATFSGLQIAGITTDINGAPRDSTPVPGAYEGVLVKGALSLEGESLLTCTAFVTSGGVTHHAALILDGESALTAVAGADLRGFLSLEGESALTADAFTDHHAKLSLAGTSALTAAGQVIKKGKLTLAGESALTVIGALLKKGKLSLDGESALTAAAFVDHHAKLELDGESALTATAFITSVHHAALSLAGTSALTGTAFTDHHAKLALDGESELTVTGKVIKKGKLSLAGESALTSDAFVDHHAKLVLDGESELTATGFISGIHHASMSLAGQSALVVAAFTDHHAVLSLAGESELTVVGTTAIDHHASMSLVGQSSLIVAAFTDHHAALSLDGESALTVVGQVIKKGKLQLSGQSTLIVGAFTDHHAALSLGGESELTCLATISGTVKGQLHLDGESSLTVTANVDRRGALSLEGESALTVSAFTDHHAKLSLVGESELLVIGGVGTIHKGQMTLAGQSLLTVDAITSHHACLLLEGESTVTAIASRTVKGVLTLSGESLITIVGSVTHAVWHGQIVLAGESELTVTGSIQGLVKGKLSLQGLSELIVRAYALYPTPHSRIYVVEAEDRIVAIPFEGRTSVIDEEEKVYDD